MWEFMVRWIVVGGVTAGMLWGGATLLGEVFYFWESVLMGVWVGFLNAFMRPLVLRWVQHGVRWKFLLILLCLNVGAGWSVSFWVPWLHREPLREWLGAWGRAVFGFFLGGPGPAVGAPGALAQPVQMGWAAVLLGFGLVVLVSVVSWAMGVVFRGHDGAWHWLDYHGRSVRSGRSPR